MGRKKSTDEFDPIAVRGGKMAASGDDTDIAPEADAPKGKVAGLMRPPAGTHGIAGNQLHAFIERIERLEEEKAVVGDDIKGVYGEAKGMGFSPKIIRKIIAIRKKGADEWHEEESVLDTYLRALGMIKGGGDA